MLKCSAHWLLRPSWSLIKGRSVWWQYWNRSCPRRPLNSPQGNEKLLGLVKWHRWFQCSWGHSAMLCRPCSFAAEALEAAHGFHQTSPDTPCSTCQQSLAGGALILSLFFFPRKRTIQRNNLHNKNSSITFISVCVCTLLTSTIVKPSKHLPTTYQANQPHTLQFSEENCKRFKSA